MAYTKIACTVITMSSIALNYTPVFQNNTEVQNQVGESRDEAFLTSSPQNLVHQVDKEISGF